MAKRSNRPAPLPLTENTFDELVLMMVDADLALLSGDLLAIR